MAVSIIWGALVVRVLVIRAQLFGGYFGAPEFWKLPRAGAFAVVISLTIQVVGKELVLGPCITIGLRVGLSGF